MKVLNPVASCYNQSASTYMMARAGRQHGLRESPVPSLKSMTSSLLTQETPVEKKLRVPKIMHMLNTTYPDTTLALNFRNPLELLVPLILAAQCTDVLVNRTTIPLFAKYRTAQDWVEVALSAFEEEI
ncbi:MAG: hypothetical protein NPIRA05_18240 [Nitrospirales bacterium]|nr:MAG: hypothetical protein NPIRA05_18240 [Nitrospirales bacterium]